MSYYRGRAKKCWWDEKTQMVAISTAQFGFTQNITEEPPTPSCMSRRAIQVLNRGWKYSRQQDEKFWQAFDAVIESSDENTDLDAEKARLYEEYLGESDRRFKTNARANDVAEFCSIGQYVNYLYRHSPTKTVFKVKWDIARQISYWLGAMGDEANHDVWARTQGAGAGWARRSAREFVEDFDELDIPSDAPKAEGVDCEFFPTHDTEAKRMVTNPRTGRTYRQGTMQCEACTHIIRHGHAKVGANCKPSTVIQWTSGGQPTGYGWESHKRCQNPHFEVHPSQYESKKCPETKERYVERLIVNRRA